MLHVIRPQIHASNAKDNSLCVWQPIDVSVLIRYNNMAFLMLVRPIYIYL